MRHARFLRKPLSGFGITVLRHEMFIRLKRELWDARRHEAEEQAIDFRKVTSDPIEALYRCRGKPFLIDVPLDRCRGVGISPSNMGGWENPFALALRHIMETRRDDFAMSPLAEYYSCIRPASAAAVMGLGTDSKLAHYPPLAAILPWQTPTPDENVRLRKRVGLDEDYGMTEYGPVSYAKGTQEIRRLLEVCRSIREQGFRRKYGDVSGTLLIGDDGDWACHISDGIHRIAALLVLGHTHVPIRISVGGMSAAVHRIDVNSWQHVRSGLLSRNEALQVFDKLLHGT